MGGALNAVVVRKLKIWRERDPFIFNDIFHTNFVGTGQVMLKQIKRGTRFVLFHNKNRSVTCKTTNFLEIGANNELKLRYILKKRSLPVLLSSTAHMSHSACKYSKIHRKCNIDMLLPFQLN